MAYIYSSNVDPLARFDQIEIQLDNGSTAILEQGKAYDLSSAELARARRYVVMTFTAAAANADPIGVTRLAVKGNPANGDVPIWDDNEDVFVPGAQSGGGGGSASDASTTVKGVSKLSSAPSSSTNPIAVGTNDARVVADQDAATASIRTLGTGATQAAQGNHAHAASAISFTPTGTIAANTVQAAIAEVAAEADAGEPVVTTGLERNGVFQIAAQTVGSSDATESGLNNRVARTAGGRLIVVHGRHAQGQQIAWRDDSTWSTVTRGSVTNGLILSGQSTGDFTSAIVVHNDTAWVFITGNDASDAWPLYARRLTDLDNPLGPNVGALQTLRAGAANSGNSKISAAVETTTGGTARIAVLWVKQTAAALWDYTVGWVTDLSSDTFTLGSETALISGTASGASRHGTLVQRDEGLGIMSRSAQSGSGTFRLIKRNRDDVLTTWTQTSAVGATTVGTTFPHAVYFNSEWFVCGGTNTTTGIVTVQRFNDAGTSVTTSLTTTAGYWQPKLAVVGETLYLVMRKGPATPGVTDEIVSRNLPAGGTTWSADRTELVGVGTYNWPQPLVDANDFNRLFIMVAGLGSTTDQRQIIAAQRSQEESSLGLLTINKDEPWYGDWLTIGNTPGSIGFGGQPTAAPATTVGTGGVTLPLTNGVVPVVDTAQLNANGGSFALGGHVIAYTGRSTSSGAGDATGAYTLSSASGTYAAGTALSFQQIGFEPLAIYQKYGEDTPNVPIPGSTQAGSVIAAYHGPSVDDSMEAFSVFVAAKDTGTGYTQHKPITAFETNAQIEGTNRLPDGYTTPLLSFGARTTVAGDSYAKNVIGFKLSHNSSASGGVDWGFTTAYDGFYQGVSAFEEYGTLNGAATLPQATIPVTGTFPPATAAEPVTVLIGANADGVGGQRVTYTGQSGGSLTGATGGTGTIATGSRVTNIAQAVNVQDPITSGSALQLGDSGYSGTLIAALRGGTDSLLSMLALTGPTNAEIAGGLTLVRLNAGSGQTKAILSVRDSSGSERFALSSGGTPLAKGVAFAAQTGGGTNTAAIDGATGAVQFGQSTGYGGREWSGSGTPTTPGGALTYNLGDRYWRTDTPTVANQRLYVVTTAGTSPTWTGVL
jgi:hypothetical protein